MCLGVGLGGFSSMVGGMRVVPMGYVGVVRRLFIVAGFVMRGCLAVMTRRVLMMFGGLRVVMRCFFRHR